jgi:hypothetical protein
MKGKSVLKVTLELTKDDYQGYRVSLQEESHRGRLEGSTQVDSRMLLDAREGFIEYLLNQLRLEFRRARDEKEVDESLVTGRIALVPRDWLPAEWEDE